MDVSIRYADKRTHLNAIHRFIDGHVFDYKFEKFWKRRPLKSLMRPFIKHTKPDPGVEEYGMD